MYVYIYIHIIYICIYIYLSKNMYVYLLEGIELSAAVVENGTCRDRGNPRINQRISEDNVCATYATYMFLEGEDTSAFPGT